MSITRPAEGWRVRRVTTHPGEVLREDFLVPLEMTANQLAVATKMPASRVGEILNERRSVSPDTALRLARYFGSSAQFWMNLQASYDLSKARVESEKRICKDVKPLRRKGVELEAVGV